MPSKNIKSAKTPNDQLEKFKAAAKELGCEDGEGRYDALLGKVATQKPTPRKPAKKMK